MKALLLIPLLTSCVTVHYQKGDESLDITSLFKTLDGAAAERGDFTLTLGSTGTTMSVEELMKLAALLQGVR